MTRTLFDKRTDMPCLLRYLHPIKQQLPLRHKPPSHTSLDRSPAHILKNVDFPDPLGPIIADTSPLANRADISVKIGVSTRRDSDIKEGEKEGAEMYVSLTESAMTSTRARTISISGCDSSFPLRPSSTTFLACFTPPGFHTLNNPQLNPTTTTTNPTNPMNIGQSGSVGFIRRARRALEPVHWAREVSEVSPGQGKVR